MTFTHLSLVSALLLASVAPLTSIGLDPADLTDEFALIQRSSSITRQLVGKELQSGMVLDNWLNSSDVKSKRTSTPDANVSKSKVKDDVSSIVGLAPGPTTRDLEYLQKQSSEADAYVKKLQAAAAKKAEVPKECKECTKYFELAMAKELIPEAKKEEELAKARLMKAKEMAEAEEKREVALPSLVRTLQKQAEHEHQLRVAAEKAVQKAQDDERVNQKRLGPLRSAIVRQRFADRIRAAEDARVAELAVKMAHEAYEKEEKKKKQEEEKKKKQEEEKKKKQDKQPSKLKVKKENVVEVATPVQETRKPGEVIDVD